MLERSFCYGVAMDELPRTTLGRTTETEETQTYLII